MENLEDIVNRCKNKKVKLKFKYSKVLTKFLLSVIFLFGSLIYIKISDENKEFYKEKIFTNSYSFTTFNNWYEKNFGSILPTTATTEFVFSNNINYLSLENYFDGEKLNLSSDYPVSNINGGIVVFVGEKENYGNTVIVQGNDGYDIWYGNLTNINVKVYDYLENETILGESQNNTLYLVIKKENEFIKYDEYKN